MWRTLHTDHESRRDGTASRHSPQDDVSVLRKICLSSEGAFKIMRLLSKSTIIQRKRPVREPTFTHRAFLWQHRTNEVVGLRMDFSSDANANSEGLLAVNQGICMPQMAEKASPDAPPNCAVVPYIILPAAAQSVRGRTCGRAADKSSVRRFPQSGTPTRWRSGR